MAKIVKQRYIKADGSKEVYSYLIPVPKKIIAESKINPDKPIQIKVEHGKIIITN